MGGQYGHACSVIMEEASPEKPALPAMPKKTSDPLPRSVPTTPTARAVAAVAGAPKTEKDSLAAEGGSDAQSTAGSAPSTPGRTPMQSARHDPSTSAPMQVDLLQIMIAEISTATNFIFSCIPLPATQQQHPSSCCMSLSRRKLRGTGLTSSRAFKLPADYLCSTHCSMEVAVVTLPKRRIIAGDGGTEAGTRSSCACKCGSRGTNPSPADRHGVVCSSGRSGAHRLRTQPGSRRWQL